MQFIHSLKLIFHQLKEKWLITPIFPGLYCFKFVDFHFIFQICPYLCYLCLKNVAIELTAVVMFLLEVSKTKSLVPLGLYHSASLHTRLAYTEPN